MNTTATSLQAIYNDLYALFRNYIWEFDVIELLADLEVEVYQAFPDVDKLKSKLKKLRQAVSHTAVFDDDEELEAVFDEFEETLDEVEGIYANLKSFKEVVVL